MVFAFTAFVMFYIETLWGRLVAGVVAGLGVTALGRPDQIFVADELGFPLRGFWESAVGPLLLYVLLALAISGLKFGWQSYSKSRQRHDNP